MPPRKPAMVRLLGLAGSILAHGHSVTDQGQGDCNTRIAVVLVSADFARQLLQSFCSVQEQTGHQCQERFLERQRAVLSCNERRTRYQGMIPCVCTEVWRHHMVTVYGCEPVYLALRRQLGTSAQSLGEA